MRKFFYSTITVFVALVMTSCYEDYIKDNDITTAYFASQKPLRTVIADRGMDIKVGVAIGGKREVDMNDWAEFEIDPDLLDGTNLELLPQDYYNLSDPNKMKVSRPTLAVADVSISFTEKFYNDPKSVEKHFALPFRVTNSSLDQVLDEKSTSIVAIKYISNYHGYYYIQGKISLLNDDNGVIEEVEYCNNNMSQNDVRLVSTKSRLRVSRAGIANWTISGNQCVDLIFNDNGTMGVEVEGDNISPIEGSGTYNEKNGKLELILEYKFAKGSQIYSVKEVLTRRQDPLNDLRFEEW